MSEKEDKLKTMVQQPCVDNISIFLWGKIFKKLT